MCNKKYLNKRIDFLALISANNCNPNGDPTSEGNMPRTDTDGYGIISANCMKRKIRNSAQDHGANIACMADFRKTDACTSFAERIEPLRKGAADNAAFAEKLTEAYWDIRAFGTVAAYKVKDVKEQFSVSLGIRGAVSIGDAFTVEPVAINDMGITKSFNGVFVDPKKDLSGMTSDRMGRRFTVQHGLYVVKGSINPFFAEKVGFTKEDAAMLKAALETLFENDESSARPAGSMAVERIYWWEYEGEDDSAKAPSISTAAVQRTVKVEKKPGVSSPRSIDDYQITYDRTALEGKRIKASVYMGDGRWMEA